jgi:tetratricopeptide (TPR) repeat protein
MLARSTAQMHQLGDRSEEATAAGYAAVPFGLLGQFAEALAYGDHGVALARALTNPYAEAAALQYRGLVHDQQGAWTQALEDFHAARRVAEGLADPFRVYLVHLYEGWTSTRAGDPAAGQVLLQQFLTLAEQMGTVFFVAMGKACLAACALALGDLDTVPALCQEAQRMAAETADRYAQAVASRVLAEALTRGITPDRQQAEQAIGDAIRLFTELEFRPELARSYVCYARLLQQWGQQETAAHYLSEAMTMFQEMSMAWDLAQAAEVRRALRSRDDR